MESDEFWIDKVDLTNLLHEIFPSLAENDNEIITKNERSMRIFETLLLKRSDFHKNRVKSFKNVKIKRNKKTKDEAACSIPVGDEDSEDERQKEYQVFCHEQTIGDIARLRAKILTAVPRAIEFHDFQLDKEYKKSILVRNESDEVLARYQLSPNFDQTKLRLVWKSQRGGRANLAPGMSTTLIVFFKSTTPEDYSEEIVINVENGLPVTIGVVASRQPPILIGDYYPQSALFPLNFTNSRDNFSDLYLPSSPKRGSLISKTQNTRIDCYNSLVHEEKLIEITIKNLGSSSRFLALSEADWNEQSIRNLSQDNELITDMFSLWPRYFHLSNNQSMIFKVFFTPNAEGFHAAKIFIICDNLSVQSLEILGDGLKFHWDFIHFGPHLTRQDFCHFEIEENQFCNNFDIDLEPEEQSANMTITNMSEFDMNFRWEVENEVFLDVIPGCGIFKAFTTLTFKVSAKNLCLGLQDGTVQLILEDLPRAALPDELLEFCQVSKNRRRRCLDPVDVSIANIRVRLASNTFSIITDDSYSSENAE